MNLVSRDLLRRGIKDLGRRLHDLESQFLAMADKGAENRTEGIAKAPTTPPAGQPTTPPAGQPATPPPTGQSTTPPGGRVELRGLNDEVRASLAFFVVFFIVFALILAWFFLGIEEVVRASALFLPLVALVLGYYFGSKGLNAAQKQATLSGEQARTATEARDKADQRRRSLERASSSLGADLTPAIVKRIKEINRDLGVPEDTM